MTKKAGETEMGLNGAHINIGGETEAPGVGVAAGLAVSVAHWVVSSQ